MKSLIKIAVIAIIAILSYNYFFGTESEKQQSQEIVNEVKELGQSLKELVVTEKEKFDEGKYDKLVQKVESVLKDVKKNLSSASESGKEAIEDKSRDVKEGLKDLKKDIENGNAQSIQSRIDSLLQKLKALETQLKEQNQ